MDSKRALGYLRTLAGCSSRILREPPPLADNSRNRGCGLRVISDGQARMTGHSETMLGRDVARLGRRNALPHLNPANGRHPHGSGGLGSRRGGRGGVKCRA